MKTSRSILLAALAATILVSISCASSAQFGRPKYTSPPAHTEGVVAGHKISVDYYSPAMHGRKIFGGLVPYDQVWCTGANIATGLTSDAPLQMGTLKIPTGSHSIWTIPTSHDWTLIINNETGQFHLNYDQSRDFGRTKMSTRPLPAPVESFTIAIRSDGGNKGTIMLDWDKTEAYMPFTVGQ
jgi:hypothetical protein